MSERDIFLAAVELSDLKVRVAYLDQACAGNPGLRAKVEALLASHAGAGSFLGNPLVSPEDPDYAATRDFSADADAENGPDDAVRFLAPPGRPDSLGRIGHYEVLQVLGRGAFGIVFRAYDDVLQRVVAVKVLAPQMAATSPARKRFLREARTSAQVRHENVVQVYEVGEQPLPYLVMEFIPGETLQQRLDRTGPLDAAEVVRVGRQIAEGLAAAHGTDLVHRDIKPGNILLEGGNQRVKITDFGLARAADDASISQSGIIAGTPMYMAPEQAKGEHIDHRADLFSLGSVLYQMLAGRAPFRASTTLAVLKRVVDDDPRPIREIIPEAPQWLCDIVTKLHAKDPAQRFPSARAVADLLAECEAKLKATSDARGFPTVAPPALVNKDGPVPAPAGAGPRQPRWKWAAAGALIVGAVVTCAVALPPLFKGRAPEQAKTEPEPQPEPQPHPPAPQPPPPALPSNYTGVPPKAIRGNDSCIAYQYSPDGKWLVTRDYANNTIGAMRVWEVATGEVRATIPNSLGRGGAFSPDSKLLVHPERDGGRMHLVVRNVGTFDVVKRWPCETKNVEGIAFDRTSAVVAACVDYDVVLWTARTGAEVLRITRDFNQPQGLAFSPTADRLLLQDGRGAFQRDGRWDHNSRVHLYDVDPKSPTFKQSLHTWEAPDDGYAFEVHFSPNGAHLLFCRGEGEVMRVAIHDAKTGAKVRDIVPQQSRTQITVGAVSPDGKRVVLRHGQDGVHVGVWNLDTGERVSGFDLTGKAHRAFAVDPTFRTACIGFHTGSEAKFYDLATGKELVPGTAPPKPPVPVPGAGYTGVPSKPLKGEPACVPLAYSRDGKWLVTHDNNQGNGKRTQFQVWEVATGVVRWSGGYYTPTFSPDGTLMAAPVVEDRQVYLAIFEVGTFAVRRKWKGVGSSWHTFNHTGTMIATRRGMDVVVFNTQTGDEIAILDGFQLPDALAFSPTADVLAVEDTVSNKSRDGRFVLDGKIALIDLDPKSPKFKQRLHTLGAPDNGYAHRLSFTPDGTRLAFTRGTADGRIGVSVYDVKTGERVRELIPEGPVRHVLIDRFLADNRTLVMIDGLNFAQLSLWDAVEGKRLSTVTIRSPGRDVGIAVDPTGRTACVGGSRTRELRFYDLATGTELVPGTAPLEAFTDADAKRIAALPAKEQFEVVRAELKKRNPQFEGPITPTFENDEMVGLTFPAAGVTDLSPLRGVPALRELNCNGERAAGSVADLSPLKGLKLTKLTLSVNPVTDLSPLMGMPLTDLHVDNSQVADLSPLAETPLKVLNCSYTRVTDLAPLKNLPLRILWANHTNVADLGPLKAAPLEWITFQNTKVADTAVLKGKPLSQIYLDFDAKRDGALLRGIPTLERINDKPATEFLKEFGSVGLPFTDADVKRIAALTAAEQLEEVRRELKKRNPGYDGTFTQTIENDVVVALRLPSGAVSDLSPVRALTRLKRLEAEGRQDAPGLFSDLAQLKGLALTELWVRHNRVSDLTPLNGMPLQWLWLDGNPVTDFAPLKHVPLKGLIIVGFPAQSLKSLGGLKIESLDCSGTQLADLTLLKDMPLKGLTLHATPVSDLAPLKGMRLNDLNIERTKVSDLSPLAEMPLTDLNIVATEVTDLTPIKGLPLKTIVLDFKPERDALILKGIKTLEFINRKPAAEFWKEMDKK